MKKIQKNVDALAPRPVHPRSVRTHGLFGIPYVRQHMVVDNRWTPASLTEQFKGMTDLLAKRLISKKLEYLADRKNSIREYRLLRNQCKDGRHKLQMTLHGANTKEIRNFLINHKDLQRLYQRMPIHLVVDNINQRTFVMRKERDRLRHRLDQLKEKYYDRLIARATLENRIKYENEFVLVETLKSRELRKKIENSNVRLKAIKTINGTYKKMIQILRQDSIFYEPILRSLDADIEDQAQFIKHILYLGMPAIAKFKELSEEFRLIEERARRDMQQKLQWVAFYKKAEEKRPTVPQPRPVKPEEMADLMKRYVRETDSMLKLKNELEAIESKIKHVKFVTLVSQAKEIYPRIKSQIENNDKLHKRIERDVLGHETLETKMKRAQVLEDVLINNLSDEEKLRLERIQALERLIREEDDHEAKTIAHLKDRAEAYVILRFSLWNLNDILRHVDRSPKVPRLKYPEPYLALPLLKFEMLTMRAVPPEDYEPNIDELMYLVTRKVTKVMKAFKQEPNPEDLEKSKNEYHYQFLSTFEVDEIVEENGGPPQGVDEELQDTKVMQNVPTRKQLKALSNKIVEENAKKEEMG